MARRTREPEKSPATRMKLSATRCVPWPEQMPSSRVVAVGRRSKCCRPPQAHSGPQSLETARPERSKRRIPSRRNRAEPPQTRKWSQPGSRWHDADTRASETENRARQHGRGYQPNRPPSTSGRAPSYRPPSPLKHLPEPGFPRMRLSECSGELIMPGGQSEPS